MSNNTIIAGGVCCGKTTAAVKWLADQMDINSLCVFVTGDNSVSSIRTLLTAMLAAREEPLPEAAYGNVLIVSTIGDVISTINTNIQLRNNLVLKAIAEDGVATLDGVMTTVWQFVNNRHSDMLPELKVLQTVHIHYPFNLGANISTDLKNHYKANGLDVDVITMFDPY